MNRLALLGLLLAASSAPVQAEEPVAPPPKGEFHLFLLAGQSNMAGRGAIADEDRVAHPRVLMLDKSGAWVPAVDPLHFDKPSAGTGLGRTFGITIANARPGITVGLVPCAVGGSPIDAWKPGGFHPSTKTHPWDDAMRRAAIALKSGTLRGILWHQGESDATPGLAPAYEAKLHDLIRRLRSGFGIPELPFVAGQMGQFPDNPWDDAHRQVDQAHRNLPAKMPHTAFVSSRDLNHKGDKVHFDSPGLRELGRRYAEAYLRLAPQPNR